tara:strand:+ start:754 stop:951 length:198 start_codon:yes stop_codon:yes gene_type:complete
MNYKFIKDPDGSINSVGVTISTKTYTKDGKNITEQVHWTIPFDEGNTDYQEYLEWAKTNTAEAAD